MQRKAIISSMGLFVACLTGAALAQTEFKPSPGAPTPSASHLPGTSAPGPGRVSARVAMGESAPDFELTKIDGKPLRLSSLRGQWVMIWFVPNRDSFTVVEPLADSLGKMGVRTLAVCYDKVQALAQRLHGQHLSYTPLADPTGDIVSLYGLLDATSSREGVKPGFVLVNPIGDVRMALLGHQLPSEDASRLVQLAVVGE
jgi:peroxiredoxin Q/BCP